jgi:hypothetical protein
MSLIGGEMQKMKACAFSCLILAILAISGCGARSESNAPPIIEHDRVVFQNGRKVRFESDKTYLQDDIVHPDISKPVTMIERAFTVEEWNRVIVETKYGYYEDSGVVFRFYDYKGKLLKKTAEYFGQFIELLMVKLNRLILVQTSAHYALTKGYILDPDGNPVITIEQRPDAFTAYPSKEGDLFLIQYYRYSKDGPFWTVETLDSEGKVLASNDFKVGGSYVIEVGDRKIPISLRNPE